jgi:hypothetical protein
VTRELRQRPLGAPAARLESIDQERDAHGARVPIRSRGCATG